MLPLVLSYKRLPAVYAAVLLWQSVQVQSFAPLSLSLSQNYYYYYYYHHHRINNNFQDLSLSVSNEKGITRNRRMVLSHLYNSNNNYDTPTYDADSILDFYDKRPLEVAWRLNILGLPLLGWYFGLVSDRLFMNYDDDDDDDDDDKDGPKSNMMMKVHRKRGVELRRHLVNSGSVALIKSGQALSLRPDLIKNEYWSEELGKLVDAVGAFNDVTAMNIIRKELEELVPRLTAVKRVGKDFSRKKYRGSTSKFESKFEDDPVLNLFEFSNGYKAVASASVGQVYKAKLRRGPLLEAAIGRKQAELWGGRTVAIKVQRPDAASSVSLDMYLLRKAAMWLSKWRGGDLPSIADQFGVQLFGELDYVREANNGERFRALYGEWEDVKVPASCISLTRRRVLVQEWIDGEKGPWQGQTGLTLVKTGLRCSVDQLLNTGLFHADPVSTHVI